jgi:hypothetical protein
MRLKVKVSSYSMHVDGGVRVFKVPKDFKVGIDFWKLHPMLESDMVSLRARLEAIGLSENFMESNL